MGILSLLFKGTSLLVLLLAMLLAGVPTKLGFWQLVTRRSPDLVGTFPATTLRWGYTYRHVSILDLSGQTALVTGANSGLGYWTSLHLARQGAHVILACRDISKCAKAVEEIKRNVTTASLDTVELDTSSLASVRACAKAVLAKTSVIDMLVLNAGRGGNMGSNETELSVDGIEILFATNHVGHHLLYKLLKHTLDGGGITGASRVVLVSSAANFDSWPDGVATSLAELNSRPSSMKGYGQSKLAQILWAQEAARREGPQSKIFINSCHPGAVDTPIFDKFDSKRSFTGMQFGWLWAELLKALFSQLRKDFMWRGEDGALTQIFLATDEVRARNIRGRYFHPQAWETMPNKLHCNNFTLQHALWEFTDSLVERR